MNLAGLDKHFIVSTLWCPTPGVNFTTEANIDQGAVSTCHKWLLVFNSPLLEKAWVEMAHIHTELYTSDCRLGGYSLTGGQRGGSAWVSCVCCSGLGSAETGGKTETRAIPGLFSASDRSRLPRHRSPSGALLRADLKPHTWLIALGFRRLCRTLVWRAVDLREMARGTDAFSISPFHK